jgi:short subunit dehydrogenase-like uncharacterized protein
VAGRIVLFGATGYTGRLVAEAMVERGLRPVLAARSPAKLGQLAEELGGGLETASADVSDPPSVRALVERDDVLVSTVGPFARWGGPAAAAATTAGANYLDSTGEPAFIREVFERYGIAAARNDCAMVTAFGYDWVPGNLAGGLALRRAGDEAVRIDVGYFLTGRGSMSGGTAASSVGALAEPSFAFRDGRVQGERGAKRVRSFRLASRSQDAVSVGSSEHFALPRLAPQLREVNAYLGWFGPLARPMQVMSLGLSLPGAGTLVRAVGERLVKGSTGGPDADARSRSGSHVVAIAYDGDGHELAEVHLTGVNGYTFTGRILAWGAERAAGGGLQGSGALGPVDGFGLVALTDGCRWAGMEEEGGAATPSASSGAARGRAGSS